MFKLKFSTANAAFDDPNAEIARILRYVADRVEKDGQGSGKIRDVNGNTVGSFDHL